MEKSNQVTCFLKQYAEENGYDFFESKFGDITYNNTTSCGLNLVRFTVKKGFELAAIASRYSTWGRRVSGLVVRISSP